MTWLQVIHLSDIPRHKKYGKVTLFTIGNRIELKANFQSGWATHIIIVTGPPTLPGQDLNLGPLSFEASAFLMELTRPDINMNKHMFVKTVFSYTV